MTSVSIAYRFADVAGMGSGGDILGVDRFEASAPGEVVLREFGFAVENVCRRAITLLGRLKEVV